MSDSKALKRIYKRSILRQRGITIVELLVGATVGLVISGMAGYFLVGLILENKNVMIETRLMQDMRAAMDVVSRDLRRAGFNANAHTTINQANNSPIFDITANAGAITYSYSEVDSSTFSTGFRLQNGVLQYLVGGSYQALTDEQFTNVTAFTITPTITQAAMSCTTNNQQSRLNIRRYEIVMVAQNAGATARDTFQRRLETVVKVRNDQPITVPCV